MVDLPTYRSASLIERLFAALRLDHRLYEEASRNGDTLGQAVMVVLVGGVLNGVGLLQRLGDAGIWAGVFVAAAGWLAWTAILAGVARLFGHRRGDRSLMRPLGFSTAPNVFLALGVVPELARGTRIAVVVWLMATTVVAVQAVYGVSRTRAVILAILGFVAYAAVYLAVGIALGV